MKKTSITLCDIAKKLNVSKVTVSKALRDHPDISQDMKEKIKAVATEIGYVPNFIARNLSSKKSRIIGLIVPKIAHNFFAVCIEAIYQAAYAAEYDIIMTVSQENPENEAKHIQTLLAMRVDGVLVSITEKTRSLEPFAVFRKHNTPLVFFDRVLKDVADNYVITNDREASQQLIQYAIDSGYRKIAHFSGYEYTNVGLERNLGFRDAMAQNSLPVNEDWVIQGGINEAAGYNGLMKLAKDKNLPELIYAFTFPVALGIYTAAGKLGLTIPGDIVVVCFGVGEYNNYLSPAITYMDQPAGEIGSQAFNLLLRKITHTENNVPERIVVPSKLRICETSKKTK